MNSNTLELLKIDPQTKELLLAIIDSVPIETLISEDPKKVKWFRFGAYDYARLLKERIGVL